jgi:PhnB protein
MAVKPIPEGYHSVTPYLTLDDATRALEFYKKAFGAVEVLRMPTPDGKIGHAEIKIGDSHVMLADENPRWAIAAHASSGVRRFRSWSMSPDVDKQVAQAVAAGGKLVRPVANSSMAIAPAASTIRSAITGISRPTSKTSRRMSSRSARRKR